jgi:hypothetical protein
MTSATMSYIPLQSAYLCQDCDSVGNCSTQCPACASEALMPLACVYDRKESEARGESIPSCHTCAIELTGQYQVKYQAKHQDAHQDTYQDAHQDTRWESIRFHHVRQRAIVR